MGAAKSKKEEEVYTISEREFNYLKILNLALQHNVFKDKLISGFLYEVCNVRYGYAEDVNLEFEIDLEDSSRRLIVRAIPQQIVDEAMKNLTDNPPV
jgi:hypothetical protein